MNDDAAMDLAKRFEDRKHFYLGDSRLVDPPLLNEAERQMIVAALRRPAQRAPLFPMAACENIANEEFDRQVKIIESATNDKALSETGRASIRGIADASALTAQRIASRIRSLAALTSTHDQPIEKTEGGAS